MINREFVRKYTELVSKYVGDIRTLDSEIKKIEGEYNILPVTVNPGEIVFIDFDFEKWQEFFTENKINFVIGHSKEEKTYLFKIENMFPGTELSIKNASLSYLPIGQGLDFRYLSEDKIIMRVLYCDGYSTDDEIEIYKTYEYNYDDIFDKTISELNTLNNENVGDLIPMLFKKGKSVENGRELWKSAFIRKRAQE